MKFRNGLKTKKFNFTLITGCITQQQAADNTRLQTVTLSNCQDKGRNTPHDFSKLPSTISIPSFPNCAQLKAAILQLLQTYILIKSSSTRVRNDRLDKWLLEQRISALFWRKGTLFIHPSPLEQRSRKSNGEMELISHLRSPARIRKRLQEGVTPAFFFCFSLSERC